MKNSGKLYLVATPIGNLEDITLRAIRILKEADIIAAEDTRHTLKLLNHLEISKPMISYHRHNEDVKVDLLIDKLEEGKNIALVTDAGTPIISDPGEEVVKVAIERGIEVIPIPGPCALITALISSGLSAREFSFYGFLSVNKKLKKEKLEQIKEDTKTVILYEAPHKIKNTLNDIYEVLGNRNIVLARELTKIHEEYIRGSVQDIIKMFENKEIKGEFIILIEGSKEDKKEIQKGILSEMTLEEHYKYYEKEGLTKNDIIKKIAKDRGVSKNEVYQHFC